MKIIGMLLWKIGFEFINLRRIFSPTRDRMKTLFYFAFGANLDPQVLLDRKITPLSTQEFALHNYQLRFTQAGPWIGAAFASIESAVGKTTYGKLYELDYLDMRRLDYFEALPFMGRHKKTFVQQDGQVLYFYQSSNPVEGLFPTKVYLQKILNGLATLENVPKDYLEHLKQTATVTDEKYGDDQQIFLKPCWWLSDAWRRKGDRLLIQVYVDILRRYSLTERWVQ